MKIIKNVLAVQEQIEELHRLIIDTEKEQARLILQKSELLSRLSELQQQESPIEHDVVDPPQGGILPVTSHSTPDEKIALFRKLFCGREDVYPKRFESAKTGKSGYQPACKNEWVEGKCDKKKIRCDNCSHRDFLRVTDIVVKNHLLGKDSLSNSDRDFTMGVYPMLLDETCWFLAADFDKTSWREDAMAFLDTCKIFNVPASLERSRSGNGGHVWIFFSEPVPAFLARKMGTYLLTQTMERRPEIGLDSYDRFFPNQDTMPKGGFGNLIALPLQKKPRDKGNSVFLDEKNLSHADQWAYLSSIRRMSRQEIENSIPSDHQHDFLGIHLPVIDENDNEPWKLSSSRRWKEPPIVGSLPDKIEIILGNQIYISKDKLTSSLRNRVIRLAAFQNPEFYQAQSMRFSTFGKPRIISCCEDYPLHIGLPRGCLENLLDLFCSIGIETTIDDQRFAGTEIEHQFCGVLYEEQKQAADEMLKYDAGVIAASTAFGKTVVAAYMIAQRKVNTLIIVHRTQLLDQWVLALSKFLSIPSNNIGRLGGGKQALTGGIDVAMIQSMQKNNLVKDLVGNYGYLIVDECHHLSAVSFEQIVRQSKAKFVTGLSATVVRKDGHQPIIFMQCGPVRYRKDDRMQAKSRPFDHRVIIRSTGFRLPAHLQNASPLSIQDLYEMLAKNDVRNRLIVEDVAASADAKRRPVLLTERRDHLELLVSMLSTRISNVITMTGNMGKKKREQITKQLSNISRDEPCVIVATGKYLGEGFDDEKLDTLFLALPISWRGTLTQYAGRLHRLNPDKKEVIIYDYVDFEVPVLARMFAKRRKGYKAIGYGVEMPGGE